MCLLFAERVAVMLSLGVDYNLANDDMGYFNSGIVFANTGTVSIYSPYPSAMVMPGMAVLLGFLSAIFGEGMAYSDSRLRGFFICGSLKVSHISCTSSRSKNRSITSMLVRRNATFFSPSSNACFAPV